MITTLKSLSSSIKKHLDLNKLDTCETVVKKYIGTDWKQYARDEHKTRIVANPLFDMYLIKWHPHHMSDPHFHTYGGCIFKVLENRLFEIRYCPITFQRDNNINIYFQNGVGYIDNSIAYHQIFTTNQHAYSLHIYA